MHMEILELENFLRKISPYEEYLLNNINLNKKENIETPVFSFSNILNSDNFDEKMILKFNDNILLSIHPRFVNVKEHVHPHIEMIYVYSGELNQIINGKRITLKEGELCILDTNVKHSLEASSKNDIIINFLMNKNFFDSGFLSNLAENDVFSIFFINAVYRSARCNNYLTFQSNQNTKIKTIFQNILCEYFDKSPCSNQVVNCYIVILFAELFRIYEKDINTKKHLYLKNINFTDILLYIENNYKSATLESTANQFYFTPTYLSTAIKKLTGQRFVDILQDVKFRNACNLMKNSNTPINEIANIVGYSNVSFFYRAFKKRFGITPAKYRENLKNKK